MVEKGYIPSYQSTEPTDWTEADLKLRIWIQQNPAKGYELLRFDYNQGYKNFVYECRTEGVVEPDQITIERPEPLDLEGLTTREQQVAKLIIDKWLTTEIAEIMGVCKQRVKAIRAQLRAKLADRLPNSSIQDHQEPNGQTIRAKVETIRSYDHQERKVASG